MNKKYYVYILSNKNNTVLYIGVTHNLEGRIIQHKKCEGMSFTAKYKVNKLVYFEEFNFVNNAIHREKCLKRWKREWKNKLINAYNKSWKDLGEDWG